MNYTPKKLEELDVLGNKAYALGDEGSPILFIAGPPGSAIMWENVQRRLWPRRTVAVEFPIRPKVTFDDIVATLGDIAKHLQSPILVSHGSAIPFALSAKSDCISVQVVTNGPVLNTGSSSKLSTFSRSIIGVSTRIGLGSMLFRSSLGLRRAVKNPYVMDSDVVDTMVAPYFSTRQGRKGLLATLRLTPDCRDLSVSVPIHIIWGDSDRFHPLAMVDEWAGGLKNVTIEHVPGGRWFYPVECPWELADRLSELSRSHEI